MVVDNNFMETSLDNKRETIGKHKAHFTAYLRLLPVSKKGPSFAITPQTAQNILKSPKLAEDVFFSYANKKTVFY